MDLHEHISGDRLAHAYVIEGSHEQSLPAVRSFMTELGVAMSGNPDYREFFHDHFSIEDARELARVQQLHGAQEERKFFVLTIRTFSPESQHALLKTIEEPTTSTHFFFLVRSAGQLLATVRSRVQVVQLHDAQGARTEDNLRAESFLAASTPDRLGMISTMTKAKADDRALAKEQARVFLAALERALHKKLPEHPTLYSTLSDVLYAERELSGHAPSLKLLLEHLAFTVPRVEQ